MSEKADLPWFRPLDAVLVLMVMAAAFYAKWGLADQSGNVVAIVNCQGDEDTLVLPAETTFWVDGRLGGLLVELQDSRARIASSPCPNKDCVKAGWLEEPGEAAVCIPSQVMLRLESLSGSGEETDAVTY
ncbi:hypothetical protein GF402_10855 [Candidatus Fermentibacteria bacterium]|nr:hypothetical protein [Candidatus Fermentibacteria bacterium]